jgi:hypothetical protein
LTKLSRRGGALVMGIWFGFWLGVIIK